MYLSRYRPAVHSSNASLFVFTLAAWFALVQSSSSNTPLDGSCQSEVCADPVSTQGQWALLQAAHMVARSPPQKDVNATLLASSAELGINPSGAAAPLTEDGYAAVADRCCQAEMTQFIERQVLNLGLEVCEQAGLWGIVPFHSCEKGPQTFAKLTADLLEDSTLRCTWVATTGNCKPVPEDCPSFGGVPPSADCGCSRSRAAKLDLSSAKMKVNNLGGLGPQTGVAEEFRIEKTGTTEAGNQFDLVVTALTEYSAQYPQYNNLYDGFGAININPKSATFSGQVDFRFSFVLTGTNTPVTLPEVHLAIFDLDGMAWAADNPNGGGREFASSTGYRGYVTDVSPNVVASKLPDGRTQFMSEGTNNNIDDAESPDTLTEEQRRNSVMFFYTDVSSFELTFGIDGESAGAGRYLFFAGNSPLNDRCGP